VTNTHIILCATTMGKKLVLTATVGGDCPAAPTRQKHNSRLGPDKPICNTSYLGYRSQVAMHWLLAVSGICALTFVTAATPCTPYALARPRRHARVSVIMFASCPDHCYKDLALIQATLSSFYNGLTMHDNHPLLVAYNHRATAECDLYRSMLSTYIDDRNGCMVESTGLANSYLQMAKLVTTEYALLLEHDWLLLPLKHNLNQLVAAMEVEPAMNQILFDKHNGDSAFARGGTRGMIAAGVELYAHTHYWSNNPSLVRVSFLRDRLVHILNESAAGALGVEDAWVDLFGIYMGDIRKAWFVGGLTVYGSPNNSGAVIQHLDTHRVECNLPSAIK